MSILKIVKLQRIHVYILSTIAKHIWLPLFHSTPRKPLCLAELVEPSPAGCNMSQRWSWSQRKSYYTRDKPSSKLTSPKRLHWGSSINKLAAGSPRIARKFSTPGVMYVKNECRIDSRGTHCTDCTHGEPEACPRL